MNRRRPTAVTLIAFMFAAAPHAIHAQTQQSGEVSSTRGTIDAANTRFSDLFNKGEAAEAAKVYASDAIIMPPNGPPIKGEAAIADFWTGGWKAGIRNVKLATTEFAVHSNYAHELGTYELEVHKPDGTVAGRDHGKYMVLWKRGADGQWKWYRDIYNSSVAATPGK